MAKAMFEFKQRFRVDGVSTGDIPLDVAEKIFPFLDRFYSSRIGIRTLIGKQPAPDVREVCP